jgi:sulfate adenylyltransferase subunit 1
MSSPAPFRNRLILENTMQLQAFADRNVTAPGYQRELVETPAEERAVLRFITAGSVDDGKSTLIGRLLHDTCALADDQLSALERVSSKRGHDGVDLSLLTDGLEAEREQGITIDVAYRYFATPKRKFIIADTPGHEQYTRNMVTGASTADAAVVLIDARKGVLPQTRRHACIAHLLDVRSIIVAVNKMDLVGYEYEVFKEIQARFLAFAEPLGITNVQFIPVSALRSDMVVERGTGIDWYRGPTLLEALEAIEPRVADSDAPMRFPVQLVVRPGQGSDFRGYAGRLESGVLVRGASVLALPSGAKSVVRDILTLEGSRTVAVAGDSVTLLLADEIDLSRGDVLVEPDRPSRVSKKFEATLCWLASEPSQPNARYSLKQTSRTVRAKLATIEHVLDIHSLDLNTASTALATNDIARVSITVQQPICVDPYQVNRATGAFILIDEATHQTVAAGMIR